MVQECPGWSKWVQESSLGSGRFPGGSGMAREGSGRVHEVIGGSGRVQKSQRRSTRIQEVSGGPISV